MKRALGAALILVAWLGFLLLVASMGPTSIPFWERFIPVAMIFGVAPLLCLVAFVGVILLTA